MTRQKQLKRRIRDRMRNTGESYTTAQKYILARRAADVPPLSQPQEAQPSPPQEALLPASSNLGATALTLTQAIEPATRELTTPPFPLRDWIKRHRLNEEALQHLEREAIRLVDGGKYTDTDKLAACAKAVLISELIDGAPRRHRYPELPCDAIRVTDEYSELEIFPSDYTPVSEGLIRDALEVAAAFSDGEDWAILSYWSSGHISGATPRARKAAVRFLRLMGAKVNVSVAKDLPEPSSAPTAPHVSVPSPAMRSNPLPETGNRELAALNAQLDGDRARALIEQADDLHGPAAEQLYAEAEQRLDAAVNVEASNCTLLCSMGKLRLSQARGAAEPMAIHFLEEARLWFEKALTVKADFFMAKVGRGDVLLEMSRRNVRRRGELLAASIQEYRAALQIRSELYVARVGLGNAYLETARHQVSEKSAKLLMDAEHEFVEALKVNPILYKALVGLGDVLVERSKGQPSTKAETTLLAAWNHYQQALQIRPSLYSALCGCGDVELERARRDEPAKAELFRERARLMYRRALDIQPASYRAANGHRSALATSQ